MKTDNPLFKDKTFLFGLMLIPVSFGLLIFLKFQFVNSVTGTIDNEGIFFLNYIIAVGYFIAAVFLSIFKNGFKFVKYSYQRFIVSLILFSISCFTINIPFTIFLDFSSWVVVYLILMHLSLIVLCFHPVLPKNVKVANFFVMGLGVIMSLYFTVYLAPFGFIAVLGSIFFGISLHLLVPTILLATFITQFIKRSKTLHEKLAFYIGIALPIIVITIYVVKWKSTVELIHKTHATLVTRPDNNLPIWVLLSQELGDDFFTERILKGDLAYETKIFGNNNFFDGGGNSLGDIMEHDPLVVIGSELMGSINIDRDDRIKILESKFDLRHVLKRKLWSGSHLSTSSVISNIQVFPDYRLAYTEKIIRIKNNNNRTWQRPEEALYTFHLPEGSVATSLSLWINGREEKSRLTTKSKADSTYATIVGVEKRDPSVLHWQEGNTITVYVFPCTDEEERMFKIGITTPLKIEDGKLVLQNVYFEGPDASSALETTIIEYKSTSDFTTNLPSSFKELLPNKFEYTGNYKPYWEASCSLVNLSTKPFYFNGKSYHLTEAVPSLEPNHVKSVYLDVNKEWSRNDFDEVWNTVKDRKVFVYYDQLHQLTEANKDDYFDILTNLNFSLFPINEIKDARTGLLISQSTSVAPMLKDLEGSGFVIELKDYLNKRDERINLFCLSGKMSPYLQTLKEFQIFNYTEGEVSSLKQLLDDDVFVNDSQEENRVKLGISNTYIIRDTNETKSVAPDHLLRLFAYNKIMQDCGRNYFTSDNYVEENLIDIANEAFIVSPISSLIVLESIRDYKRFDIEENKNSLKNASTSSAGAVPEPHEWALIIILSFTLVFLYYKQKNAIKLS